MLQLIGLPPIVTTDMESPTLICPEDIEDYADGESTTPVEWIAPTPSDNSGVVPWSNSSHTSGDLFAIDDTVVTYAAWDPSGNKATCSFTVIVTGKPSSRIWRGTIVSV